MKPYLHTFKQADGKTWDAVFAIKLDSIAAERRGMKGDDDFLLRWLKQQMDFINTLFCPEPSRVFAVRCAVTPNPALFSAGRVEIALLCKVQGGAQGLAKKNAELLCAEMVGLLAGAMPNYGWAVLTEASAFQAVWQPFDFKVAHIAEIRRREDLVRIETMRPRPSLGRGRVPAEPIEKPENAIFFVHPFLPRPTTLGRLLRTLLLHGSPIVFQAAVSPVWMSKFEKQALGEEISKCEDAARRHSSADNGGIARTQTIHAGRARSLCDGLLEQFVRLQDAPFLLQIALASPDPLPASLLESAGVEITFPTSNREEKNTSRSSDLYGGGYDTVRPASAEDEKTARGNLCDLTFTPWGQSFAPQKLARIRQLVDADEAAGAFRFPVAGEDGLEGLEVRNARQRSIPRGVAIISERSAEEKLLLGENRCFGTPQAVNLGELDRRQHMYVVGQTGTGKTSLLKTMILSDIAAGKGLAVIDPHGDLYREIRAQIPRSRWKDVVLLDPTDADFPIGLNLLECRGDDDRHFVAREMRAIMERLMEDQYQYKAAEYTGPVFYQHMQMNMLLAMSNVDDPGTLLEFYEIYHHPSYWKRWLPLRWKDPTLQRWVDVTLAKMDYTRRNSEQTATWGEYLSSKFDDFVFDPKLRLIFGQKRSTIDMSAIMDEGKILLVNLAKGELAETNARFLGMLLMAKIQAAAMGRVRKKASERRMFYLYVDEFQALATQNFITMLSEARKFGLGLVLANQFFSQIKDPRIMESIVGNVGTTICFRLGREDAEALEPQFLPFFDRYDLANLPNWNACVKTTAGGQVAAPFSLRTVLPRTAPDAQAGQEVKARSRKKYGRSRAVVEAEISKSLCLSTALDHKTTPKGAEVASEAKKETGKTKLTTFSENDKARLKSILDDSTTAQHNSKAPLNDGEGLVITLRTLASFLKPKDSKDAIPVAERLEKLLKQRSYAARLHDWASRHVVTPKELVEGIGQFRAVQREHLAALTTDHPELSLEEIVNFAAMVHAQREGFLKASELPGKVKIDMQQAKQTTKA